MTVVKILLFVALFLTLLALGFNLLGLKSNDLHRKFILYKGATYLSLLSGKSVAFKR